MSSSHDTRRRSGSPERHRPRARTVAQSLPAPAASVPPQNAKHKHARAASELQSRARGNHGSECNTVKSRRAASPANCYTQNSTKPDDARDGSRSSYPPALTLEVSRPAKDPGPAIEMCIHPPHNVESSSGQTRQPRAVVASGPQERTGVVANGTTLEDLVSRLFALPMSRPDINFIYIFLCFYRMFAPPARLLATFQSHFSHVGARGGPQLLKLRSQLRTLEILSLWIRRHPGDFAYPSTRKDLSNFVGRLANNRVFAPAVQEISKCLGIVKEDDDTFWACSDVDDLQATPMHADSDKRPSGLQSPQNDELQEANGKTATVDLLERPARHSKSSSTVSSDTQSGSLSGSSALSPLDSLEIPQSGSSLPVHSQVPLTKIQWRQVMECSDDEIARELTRLDWDMYSTMKPRDLLRHISSSAKQKEKYKNLEYVSRMIDHFNHIAFWVSHLVLLRDKAKHRAKALEKLMSVAWKLRQFNSYNSLAAVIAGASSTAVYRLSQTRELVSSQVHKQFMRLQILMGTQRSHSAYRLAWANTTGERVPFLPLHRRDLISAESGNETFLDSDKTYINWRKFEIMGNIVIDLQNSQEVSRHARKRSNLGVQRLILGVKVPRDEDELYARSLQVEGLADNEPKKRFNWFQK